MGGVPARCHKSSDFVCWPLVAGRDSAFALMLDFPSQWPWEGGPWLSKRSSADLWPSSSDEAIK
jgi:hypothetical protein